MALKVFLLIVGLPAGGKRSKRGDGTYTYLQLSNMLTKISHPERGKGKRELRRVVPSRKR